MDLGLIKRLNLLLTGLVSVLMLVSLGVQTTHFGTLFRPLAEPELARKAEVVGSYVTAQLERAVGAGIPVDRLVGVDDLLADSLAANPDVKYIAFSVDGTLRAFAGDAAAREGDHLAPAKGEAKAIAGRFIDTVLPMVPDSGHKVTLHVGMRADYVQGALNDIVYDLGSVLIVAILLNIEILLLVVGVSVGAPLQRVTEVIRRAGAGETGVRVRMRRRDEVGQLATLIDRALDRLPRGKGAADAAPEVASASSMMHRVVALRFAIFIFSLAEELTRTFLSVYIKDLFKPVPGLTPELVIGAPIALFMLLWALSQPIAGSVSEQRGRRRVFLFGALMSTIGLIGSGLAGDLVQLIVARCVTAVGYASVFIAAQGFVIDASDPRQRAQALAIYAGGILTAGVCGPAIGGVVADQIGFRMTFLISAVLAFAAGVIAWAVLPPPPKTAREKKRGVRLSDVAVFMRNRRFVGLVLFSAVPAKLGLTALLFFLLPLALDDRGVSQSWIGRVLLLYWLLMIFVTPMAAKLSDRLGKRTIFMVIGGILAACAAYILSLPGSLATAIAGVALLGVAHALVGSPQMALLADVCKEERAALGETAVIGMFRLIERLGSVIAPFLAGLFLARYGYSGALKGIGAVLAACVAAQLLMTATGRTPPAADLPQRDPA